MCDRGAEHPRLSLAEPFNPSEIREGSCETTLFSQDRSKVEIWKSLSVQKFDYFLVGKLGISDFRLRNLSELRFLLFIYRALRIMKAIHILKDDLESYDSKEK